MALVALEELINTEPGCTLSTTPDTANELLSDVAREVVLSMPSEVLAQFASAEDIPTAGLDVLNKHVVKVEYDQYGQHLPLVPQSFKTRYTVAGDGRYRDPGYAAINEAGTLYVYERGSTTALNSVATAYTITLPTQADNSGDFGAYTANIPPLPHRDSVRLVAYKVQVRLLEDAMSNARINDLLASASLTLGTAPVMPGADTITAGTITAGSASAPTVTAGQQSETEPTDETPTTVPSVAANISDAEYTTFTTGTPLPTDPTSATTPTWPSADFALDETDWDKFIGTTTESPEMLDRINTYFQRKIEEASVDVQHIITGFNAELDRWRTEWDRLIRNEDWLALHQSQTLAQSVGVFRTQVEEQLGQYRTTMEGAIANARMTTEAAITKARLDTEADIATGQMDTQVAISKAEADLRALIAGWETKVGAHAGLIQDYVAEAERQATANQEKIRVTVSRWKSFREQILRIERRYNTLYDRYVDMYGTWTSANLRVRFS